MKKIAQFLIWLMGWKIEKNYPKDLKQCVIVVGPHTSNWDFFIGKLAFLYYGIKGKFLIKKEAFFFPFGYLLKAIGGVPVNRKQRSNITETAVKFFQEEEELFLVFTPEGTRSYNPNWKKGFYYIAMKTNVPIFICYMDYARKIGGFYGEFKPSGDAGKDIEIIKGILSQYKGKYPENGIY
ncbi:MAG: acyltransferase [Bacteroidetes bacterium]|nr:acyltransferase [Bacteroidota bacterium]